MAYKLSNSFCQSSWIMMDDLNQNLMKKINVISLNFSPHTSCIFFFFEHSPFPFSWWEEHHWGFIG